MIPQEAENKDLFKQIVEVSPGALILIDEKGIIIFINRIGEKLFQYEHRELIGKPLEILIPSNFKSKHPEHRTNYLKKPETRAMGSGRDLYALKNNNSQFPAEIGLNPIQLEGKIYILASVVDISERKKYENEINIRNKQLAALSLKLTNANQTLELKNQNLNESIQYAKKIQLSILPEKQNLRTNFENLALFYKPKGIIGGDFYWFKTNKNIKHIASIDCTGHGVPGAMLSIVVFSILNEVYDEFPDAKPGKILEDTHLKLYSFLQQDKGENFSQDGCQISLCKINEKTKTLEFAGSKENLYIYENGEINIIKGTLKSIGGSSCINKNDNLRTFKTEEIKIEKKAIIAMTTDGILDQLDKDDKIFGYNHFKKLIISNANNHPDIIEKKISLVVDNWIQGTEQFDDILVLMFHLNFN